MCLCVCVKETESWLTEPKLLKKTKNECYQNVCVRRTAGRLVVDAVAVEDEGAVRGVDADGHRPLLEESQLERLAVSRRHVTVAPDPGRELGGVSVAETILETRDTHKSN